MGIESRIRRAWQGRISGCMLGKPIEVFSMQRGTEAVQDYLDRVSALPLRDYIPLDESVSLINSMAACCRGHLTRSEPDDDVHYSVLALMMLEAHGRDLTTRDVALTWLRHLPVASTFTAERAAYRIMLERGEEWFPERGDPGFDLTECSDNPYNDWIGAQIRTDVYGWVTPGNPELARTLAVADAGLSHRGDGVLGAVFVAVAGSLIPDADSLLDAIDQTLGFIDEGSGARAAIEMGIQHAGNPDGGRIIREHYEGMSPVHTLNNLALVVWALLSHPDDFDAAIGDVVAEGLDTDCNGATVGGLWALQDKPIPSHWTQPWQGRVGLNLGGQSEVTLDDLVERTVRVAENLGEKPG
jgi:ADP-ribosylglycohydrolase